MLKRTLKALLVAAVFGALWAAAGRSARAAEGHAPKLRAVEHAMPGDFTVSILDGDRPVLRYRYDGVPRKPYVDELFSPAGVQILRDSPFDHKHHHSLMFAVRVDGVNFWEESKPEFGVQKHRSIGTHEGIEVNGFERQQFVDSLDWMRPASEDPLLLERREIAVLKAPDFGATLIEWRSRLELPPGKESAVISGAHYNGLGMRFLTSMDKGGRFFFADGSAGADGPDKSRLTRARWCAYTAKADGKPVTVAMFDHPGNFRPATMFTLTRGFAYLSATLNEWKEPITLKARQPLNLCYGIALWDGEVEKAAVEKLYQRWVKLSAISTP